MPIRHASSVAVYGASGHTGGFVLDELARRGIDAVPVGRRDGRARSGAPLRVAPVDDPDALLRAFSGCSVVINAAGPFLDTAAPVASAALRAGCHYLDLTAEQVSARATLRDQDAAARGRGLAAIPAAGFYGGLADLLASAMAHDARAGGAPGGAIDSISVAIALDRWWPTPGTRSTGARNTFARLVIEDGQLVPLAAALSDSRWDFGPPLGAHDMVALPFSEMVCLLHHLPVQRARAWFGTGALADLRDPSTAPPTAVDALGRSPQRFAMDVVLADANGSRRARASGQDIYAVSAPLVVEAAARLIETGPRCAGAQSLGAAFEPRAFLDALAPAWLQVEYGERIAVHA